MSETPYSDKPLTLNFTADVSGLGSFFNGPVCTLDTQQRTILATSLMAEMLTKSYLRWVFRESIRRVDSAYLVL